MRFWLQLHIIHISVLDKYRRNLVFQRQVLGVVKRNPLFLHEIEWKNNGFLFTTPNILHILKRHSFHLSTFHYIKNLKGMIMSVGILSMGPTTVGDR